MYEPNLTLSDHDNRSAERAEEIKSEIKHVGHKVEKMNIFKKKDGGSMDALIPLLAGVGGNQGGTGSALAAGVGGGLLGGLLFNRNGLGGADGGVVTPANLTAALAGVTDTLQNTTVVQGIGDIKANVQLAEAQVQLALAGVQSDLSAQANVNQAANTTGQAAINKNISESIATALAGQSAIKESIAAYGVANLTATKDAQYALATAINADGEKTRALITSNEMANLQRMLTVSESRALEDRLFARTREVEVNVTNTNTNTAQAIQAQNQAQAQSQAIIQLAAELRNLGGDIQAVRQSQSNINFGVQSGTSQGQAATNNKVA